MLLYRIAVHVRAPLWQKGLLGGVAVTAVEFLTGLIVNVRLGWRVWDYSGMALNLMGQICVPFFLMWTVLAVPIMWLSRRLDPHLFPERKNKDTRETGYDGSDSSGAAGRPHCG